MTPSFPARIRQALPALERAIKTGTPVEVAHHQDVIKDVLDLWIMTTHAERLKRARVRRARVRADVRADIQTAVASMTDRLDLLDAWAGVSWERLRDHIPQGNDPELSRALRAAGWTTRRIERDGVRSRVWWPPRR